MSGALVATLVYGVVSGALVNPVGFRRRVAFLLGPASQTWAGYPRGMRGALQLGSDALAAIPHFTSWPIAVAAVFGMIVAVFANRGLDRARVLMPLLAAVSFTWLFSLGARRSEDRFLLPQTLFALPYAALLVARTWEARPAARPWLGAFAAACVVPALVGVASIDGTLLADSRYEAERFLAGLPPSAHVEILGTTLFLPRLPPGLAVVRPGTEPVADRQKIPGVTELVDPAMDPRPRAPDYIVLATALSLELVTQPPPPPSCVRSGAPRTTTRCRTGCSAASSTGRSAMRAPSSPAASSRGRSSAASCTTRPAVKCGSTRAAESPGGAPASWRFSEIRARPGRRGGSPTRGGAGGARPPG